MPLVYQSSLLSLATSARAEILGELSVPAPSRGLTQNHWPPGLKLLPQFAFPSSLLAGCAGRLSFPIQASYLGLCPRCSLQKEHSFSKDPHLHFWSNSNVINTVTPSLTTTTPSQKSPVVFSVSHSPQYLPGRSLLLSAACHYLPYVAFVLIICIDRAGRNAILMFLWSTLSMNPAHSRLTG